MKAAASVDRTVHCPCCGVGVAWNGNPYRPFCSLSCRLIDLGVWLDERYRIPGPEMLEDRNPDEPVVPGG